MSSQHKFISFLFEQANFNNIYAQILLAKFFYFGYYVYVNKNLSRFWLETAANTDGLEPVINTDDNVKALSFYAQSLIAFLFHSNFKKSFLFASEAINRINNSYSRMEYNKSVNQAHPVYILSLLSYHYYYHYNYINLKKDTGREKAREIFQQVLKISDANLVLSGNDPLANSFFLFHLSECLFNFASIIKEEIENNQYSSFSYSHAKLFSEAARIVIFKSFDYKIIFPPSILNHNLLPRLIDLNSLIKDSFTISAHETLYGPALAYLGEYCYNCSCNIIDDCCERKTEKTNWLNQAINFYQKAIRQHTANSCTGLLHIIENNFENFVLNIENADFETNEDKNSFFFHLLSLGNVLNSYYSQFSLASLFLQNNLLLPGIGILKSLIDSKQKSIFKKEAINLLAVYYIYNSNQSEFFCNNTRDEAISLLYNNANLFSDSDAEFFLGLLLNNDELKLKYFLLSAEQGNVSANTFLGIYYYSNNDSINAMKHFQIAAHYNSSLAQYCLGRIFEVEFKDYEKAFDFFHQSAIQGFILADKQVASYYMEGFGANVDLYEASRYYQIVLSSCPSDLESKKNLKKLKRKLKK